MFLLLTDNYKTYKKLMKDYKNENDLVDFLKELNETNDKVFNKIVIRLVKDKKYKLVTNLDLNKTNDKVFRKIVIGLVKDKEYKLITNLDINRLNKDYLFTGVLIEKIAFKQDTLRLTEVINFIKELGDFGKKLDLSNLIGTHASWFLYDLVDGRTWSFSNFDENPYKKELEVLKREIGEIAKLRLDEGYHADNSIIRKVCIELHNDLYQSPLSMTSDGISFVDGLIGLYVDWN